MTIDLTPEQKRFVKTKIETGHFPDEAAVIAYMLDTWQQWEKRTSEIRARVEEGIKAADEGRGTLISTPEEAEAFKQDVIRRGKELRAKRLRDAP